MKAKDYLGQGYRLDQRIDSSSMEASGFRELGDRIRSLGTGIRDCRGEASELHCLKRLGEAERRLDDEIGRLLDLKKQILEVIGEVPDPNERMILMYRYINNLSWEQISRRMFVDRTTVYRWHDAALKHVRVPKDPIRA